MNLIINIPVNMEITLIQKMGSGIINIYIFNKNKNFLLYYKNDNLFIDKWCNSIEIKNNKLFNKIKTINFFNIFLKSLNTYFFEKIKFKGKGFRIKFFRNIKLIKFFFGRSHKTFILLKNTKKKRINKYKFLIYNIKIEKLKLINKFINKIKPINLYTLRGLRNSKQTIFKRKGKKGTYI